MKRLEKLAEAAASALLRCESVRVISHNDADGIASAGLICSALKRAGIPFHATLVKRLDESVLDMVEPPVVFCDMGSGKPDLISGLDGDVFVFDHHRPVGELDCIHVNPHLVGVDGAFELSASGTVYSVVRQMGDNVDLAGLALVGALGDRQMMVGANRAVLEEAVDASVVETRPGLKMEDGPLDLVLEMSLDPLLDITGDLEKVREFLDEVGVHGDLPHLAGKDLSRIATALVLKILMQNSFAADSVVGETLRLRKEVVENAFEFVWILNSCGKTGETGLGLSLCMRDDGVLDEGRKLTTDYKREILSEIVLFQEHLQETDHIRYAIMDDMESTGMVAGLGMRYLYTDLPIIILNRTEDLVKVSARGNRFLIHHGLDLSIALKKAAESVGGGGGGHNVASGAAVPLGREEEFIRCVDQIVAGQLKLRS